MKRAIAMSLAIIIIISTFMIGCSKDNNDNGGESTTVTTTKENLVNNEDEYILEEVEVTDSKGEVVTDKNGTPVTTQNIYKEVTNKKGDKVIGVVDEKGEVVTNKKGDVVTAKYSTTKPGSNITLTVNSAKTSDMQYIILGDNRYKIMYNGKGSVSGFSLKNMIEGTDYKIIDKDGKSITFQLTASGVKKNLVVDATVKQDPQQQSPDVEIVGEETQLSREDVIKEMLEVPYLYEGGNYGFGENVPVSSAAHAAIWMAKRTGQSTTTFASGVIVLELFKYFGQTVVNFKNTCNSQRGTANITYNANNDSFSIPSFEDQAQTVNITKIQKYNPGKESDHNYYKVTASVSNCSKSSVVAIVEENKLDSTLGYSIKSLQWS